MLKRFIIVVIVLLIIFGGIFGWKAFKAHKIAEHMKHASKPPVTVSTTRAREEPFQDRLQAVATLQSVQGVEITTQQPGKVVKFHFHSGQQVSAGDLLVQLNTRTDQAELKRRKAVLELRRLNLKRQRRLAKTQAASRSALDKARAQYQEAQAQVKAEQALIDQKRISAPFDGVLGIRKVNLGQYLSPGQVVVSLNGLDHLYVNFNLPQQDRAKVKVGQKVRFQVDTFPGQTFNAQVSAIDSHINAGTRNFAVQAEADNPQHQLQPGMFGEASLLLGAAQKVVVLPRTAISYKPYGNSVFLIRPDNSHQGKSASGGQENAGKIYKVHRVFVKTGEARNQSVAILKGVKAGQRVVTAGQLKLSDGSRVRIDNSHGPSKAPSQVSQSP